MHTPFTAFPETLATENAMICNLRRCSKLGDKYGVTGADGTGPFTLDVLSSRVRRSWSTTGPITPAAASRTWPTRARRTSTRSSGCRSSRSAAAPTRSRPAASTSSRTLRRRTSAGSSPTPKLVTTEFPALANWWISLDCSLSELGFDDVRVRQAISHAIDRKALAESLYFGHAVGTYGPIAPNVRWYDKGVEAFNQFDLDKSASLLDAAGWKMGSGGVREKNGTEALVDAPRRQRPAHHLAGDRQCRRGHAAKGRDRHEAEGRRRRQLQLAGLRRQEPPASWSYEWLWSSPIDLLVYFHVVPSDAYNGSIASVKQACAAWQSAASIAEHGDSGEPTAARVGQVPAEDPRSSRPTTPGSHRTR